GLYPPADPVLITTSGWYLSMSIVVDIAAFTLPIPDRNKIISLLPSVPTKNSHPAITSVCLFSICSRNKETSSSIAPIIATFILKTPFLHAYITVFYHFQLAFSLRS